MTPISLNTNLNLPYPDFQGNRASISTLFLDTGSAETQPSITLPDAATALDQLPEGLVFDVTAILEQIRLSADLAARPDQTFDTRLDFQADITETLSELQTVFEEIAQDDLRLFTAIFVNQLPDFGGSSGSSRDESATSAALDRLDSDTLLAPFLNIDVTSELGALYALDLTGSAIDLLSGSPLGLGSDFLEVFLDSLSDSLFSGSPTGETILGADEGLAELNQRIALLQARNLAANQGDDSAPGIISLAG